MKATILKRLCVGSVAVAMLLSASGMTRAQPRSRLKLNEEAFAFGVRLIKQGHFIADRKGSWSQHRPSTELENDFIRQHGFGEYAKWHLAIDERYAENTKRRYKFPYGDFKNVHRCGVLAVQSRAGEYKYSEIENAAAELRALIEATRNTTR
jgi:hypothetical protein